ncbi:MAG TPA: FecR domain-containing protein [Polyangiaceae bacterium]|nr:FecR domain-containing protein [Polyangiaceae bacterium]
MTKHGCPRSFEAEALRDGRLAGAERLSFQRHLDSCPRCAREVAALQTLAVRLRESAAEADADELHVRRERTRLLAAFDATLAPHERSPGARGWLVGAAAASLLLLGLSLHLRARSALHPGAEGAVVVHAAGTASWSRQNEGAVEKILLERGALSIRVDHTPQRRRLLVVLPDGELEDIGTTFTVSAEAGRTTRVSVESGSVVLRLHGQAPLALSAGDTWTPSQRAIVSTCPSCEPTGSAPATGTPLAPPSAAPAASPPSIRSQHARPALGPVDRTASPSASATGQEPQSSLDFRAAMTALDGGDNVAAAAGFSSFLSAHPRDARCEDAAYLRVIAWQRAGDAGRMQEAVARYLRQFPSGFRHAEVAALAR